MRQLFFVLKLPESGGGAMTKIFTIGFGGKKPEVFLEVLDAARINCVWDIRLWRRSAYVPYYNGDNLAVALGNRYEYHPEFAPSAEMLADYKDKKLAWGEFEQKYRELLNARNPLSNCDINKLDRICLLCTEKTADMCHRWLVAEYIASQVPDVEIVHL